MWNSGKRQQEQQLLLNAGHEAGSAFFPMLWFADSSLCLVCNGKRAWALGSELPANSSCGFSALVGPNSDPSSLGMDLGEFCWICSRLGPASWQQKQPLTCPLQHSGSLQQLSVALCLPSPWESCNLWGLRPCLPARLWRAREPPVSGGSLPTEVSDWMLCRVCRVPWLHRCHVASPSCWWGWPSMCLAPGVLSAPGWTIFGWCFPCYSEVFGAPLKSYRSDQPGQAMNLFVVGYWWWQFGTTCQLCLRLLLAPVSWLTGITFFSVIIGLKEMTKAPKLL